MSSGIGWIAAGIVLAGGGLAFSLYSKQFVLYGAVIVGIIWIGRGAYRIVQAKRAPSSSDE